MTFVSGNFWAGEISETEKYSRLCVVFK
jgi:hypothetical protein